MRQSNESDRENNLLGPTAHRGPVRRARGHVPVLYDREEIFRFIVAYKREHDGNSPALSDIMAGCGVSGRSVAWNILRGLERRGRIRLPHRCGTSRSIEIPGGRWTLDPEKVA